MMPYTDTALDSIADYHRPAFDEAEVVKSFQVIENAISALYAASEPQMAKLLVNGAMDGWLDDLIEPLDITLDQIDLYAGDRLQAFLKERRAA